MNHVTRKIVPADPRASYLAAKSEILAAVTRVLESGTYIHGAELAAFEQELAHFIGLPAAAVGVANGTDAIELALRALGIGLGDEVITVANTVTATVSAICATGARPVFVEIDESTMLMSPESVSAALSRPGHKIKAIVPVHLYGHMCDMPALTTLAARHSVVIVEDCAQAHGSQLNGKTAGAWGDLAAFSFYPTKNIGAFGDAGAVAGRSVDALARVRRIRQYGWRERYISEEQGRNSRLDEIQAAILRIRLTQIEKENQTRAEIAAYYRANLAGSAVRIPGIAAGHKHTWHQFVVRTPRRDELKRHLETKGVIAGVLYPVPVHMQPAYRAELDLPVTEAACNSVLSLPLHAGMHLDDAATVVAAVKAWA